MIGHVSIGASFYHLIRYVLEDKKELSEAQKNDLALQDDLQHRDRAEVLEYNQCFGNKQELTEQFRDVAKLSRRVEKPVLHLSLRLAPGEALNEAQLAEIGRACAIEFGVADHQYICVLHKDTKEQHIHIAANRVGFDGKATSDSNSYKRMANLCRRLEKQYGLQEVLSPRAFLSPKDRQLPRHDKRKEKLKEDIRQVLQKVASYAAFERQMQVLGYTVLKGRGISFIDNKKVKIKGSEVGFSLAKIDRVLSIQQQLAIHKARQQHGRMDNYGLATVTHRQPLPQQAGQAGEFEAVETVAGQLSNLLSQLLQTEYAPDYIDPELIREAKKKYKKKPGQQVRR